MKKLLTLFILLYSIGVMAQSKHHKRYFKTVVSFETTDGCYRSAIGTNYFNNGYSANYDGIYAIIAKWIRPYKIKPGTFKITSIERISEKEALSKTGKFQPCGSFFKDNGLLLADSTISFTSASHFEVDTTLWHLQPSNYIFFGINSELLNVSSPDSTGTYTVKFALSKVKFINDSTFTFKIK